jgi:hypothetical protein
MNSAIYLLSILLAISAWIVGAWLLWQGVELAYRVYCKVRGIEY